MDLLDIIQNEEAKDKGECLHLREKQTETKWPGEDFTRLTMTCADCGRIRGRYPREESTV